MIKHITKKLLTSILVGTTLVIPITTFGFGTDTHKAITEIACNNLSSYIEKNDRKLIIDNSVWPDYYENDMGILQPYRSHFIMNMKMVKMVKIIRETQKNKCSNI